MTKANANASIFDAYKTSYDERKEEVFSLADYLELCKKDKMTYANPAERLLKAFGEPELVDTSKEKGRLNTIFQNKTIALYPAFKDFYGMEETIEKIASHIRGAAEGGEYLKQILYLLGPVGGGKSSLGERVKELMEVNPIYVLRNKETGERSPINESPLGLFNTPEVKNMLTDQYEISSRYLKLPASPWALKRLQEGGGKIDEVFEVIKVFPSMDEQLGIAKVEPGDENNQDISTLVGKVDINKLGEGTAQDDVDTYLFSGGFAKGHQGVMEFVEMFKAPLKVLNPLLEAMQARKYTGTEQIGAIPLDSLILAHSNDSEWAKFSGNKDNEAMLDRVNVINVPYSMRYTDEKKIYQKMLDESGYGQKPVAPKTLELLAKFAVVSRVLPAGDDYMGGASADVIADVLDGRLADGASAQVPSYKELKQREPVTPGSELGMRGASTRFNFKTLTETFNARVNHGILEADPITLMEVLKDRVIKDNRVPNQAELIEYIDAVMAPEYKKFLTSEVVTAFTNADETYLQNRFDRYVAMAKSWVRETEFNDQEVSGKNLGRDELEQKLAEIERGAGISNPETFRKDVAFYVMEQRENGKDVKWDSYNKLGNVIRQSVERRLEDILPLVAHDTNRNEKQTEEFNRFVDNMSAKGYTPNMIKNACTYIQP
jgi:serine protein kinase